MFCTKIQSLVILPLEIFSNTLKPDGFQGELGDKYVQDLHKQPCIQMSTFEDHLVRWEKQLAKSEVKQQLAESEPTSLEQSLTKVVALGQSVERAVSAIMTGMVQVSADLVEKPTTAYREPKPYRMDRAPRENAAATSASRPLLSISSHITQIVTRILLCRRRKQSRVWNANIS